MDNHDIEFIMRHLDEVYKSLMDCEGTFDGLLMYLETYIKTSTIDIAIVKSIKHQMVTVMNLIQDYNIKLEASKL